MLARLSFGSLFIFSRFTHLAGHKLSVYTREEAEEEVKVGGCEGGEKAMDANV